MHVGATCPADRVRDLLRMLGPSGGLLLAPVGSESWDKQAFNGLCGGKRV